MKKIIYFLLISICILSCDDDYSFQNEITISAGFICGWCTGADSLVINRAETNYSYYTSCNSNPVISIKEETAKNEWNELLLSLNFEKFKKINIDECNVCADGCDIWISVTKGLETNKITYGYDDSLSVNAINPLINKLEEIKNHYRPSAD